MDFSRPLTLSEKKEMRKYVDDFLYHMEDNFCMAMEQNPQLKKWGLKEICDRLNEVWHELDEQIANEEKRG